jgi:hypothetical protein
VSLSLDAKITCTGSRASSRTHEPDKKKVESVGPRRDVEGERYDRDRGGGGGGGSGKKLTDGKSGQALLGFLLAFYFSRAESLIGGRKGFLKKKKARKKFMIGQSGERVEAGAPRNGAMPICLLLGCARSKRNLSPWLVSFATTRPCRYYGS